MRRVGEELRRLREREPGVGADAQVQLVHQRRGVQRRAIARPALTMREASQLLIDLAEQRIDGFGFADFRVSNHGDALCIYADAIDPL